MESAREMVRKVVKHIKENEECHRETMDGIADNLYIIARSLENDDIPSHVYSKVLNTLHHSIINSMDDYKCLHDADNLFDLYKEGGALS